MYNPGQEISSIDFGAIIGGSLNAVVKAQSQSAQTTVDFIKKVGFQKKLEKDEDGNTIETDVPINVAFSYEREVSPAQVLSKQIYSVKISEQNPGANYKVDDVSQYKLMAGDTELLIKIESIEVGSKGELTKVTLGVVPEGASYDDGTVVKLTHGDGADPNDDAELTLHVKINSVSNTSSENKYDARVSSDVKSGWFVRADLRASFSNQKQSSSSEEVKKDYSLNIKVHAAQDDMPAGVSRILDMLEDTIKAQPVGVPQQPEQA